jgi:pyridoxal phosphate enzyme (YggS family)
LPVNLSELKKIQSCVATFENANLCVVTKTRPISDIEQLIKLGQKNFAENRVQEAEIKYAEILKSNTQIKLHLIGPLQSNKVKTALSLFDVIQSIDRPKIVDSICKNSKKMKTKTKEFYIQVNIGDEKQKSGVHKSSLKKFYEYCIERDINVRGLMCIPPNDQNSVKYFDELNLLKENLNKNLFLSMGMSSDYQIALKSGSNMVRIGSRIFE